MTSVKDLHLYRRQGAYIPRVAAVHDLCGYGNCSLGVAIPVLSAAGCDVCPVPTSLFSSHTGFSTFHMHDTTSMLNDYLDAWNAVGVQVDAVYSGFLGSADQVAIIQRLYREHPSALRFVDPVMGDGGKKYPTYTDAMCDATRDLVAGADVLTPNLTEASILTGIPYTGQDVDEAYVRQLGAALLNLGAKTVVIKGVVHAGEKIIHNYVVAAPADAETAGGAVNSDDSPKTVSPDDVAIDDVPAELLPFMLHGTGDLFASGVLGAVMAGKSLLEAVQFAGQMVHDAMVVSRQQPNFETRGVSFESVLGEMTSLVR